MLEAGNLMPHFDVTNLHGERIRYATIWQRRNLVLVILGAAESGDASTYVAQLTAQFPPFPERDTVCVMTRDEVTGIPSPGVVVADRWGEIVHVAAGSDIQDLPAPYEIAEWVGFVQRQCPECEGEVK